MQQRTLHDPVTHRGDAQRALFATAELLDPRAPHRLWFITALLQQPGDQGDFFFGSCFHGLGRLPIHTRRPSPRRHRLQCQPQVLWGKDLVDQRMPLPAVVPSCEGRQHRLRPDQPGVGREHQLAPLGRATFPTACSRFQHWRWCFWAGLSRSRLHLPTPLRSTTRPPCFLPCPFRLLGRYPFQRYYGGSVVRHRLCTAAAILI